MKVRIPDHVDMTNVLDLTKGKMYEVDDNEYIKDDVGVSINIIFECEKYAGMTSIHLCDQAAFVVVKD